MTLKQKVRKYNKDFEAEIQSFRENPVNSDEEQAEQGVPSNTTLHILYIVHVYCILVHTLYMYCTCIHVQCNMYTYIHLYVYG